MNRADNIVGVALRGYPSAPNALPDKTAMENKTLNQKTLTVLAPLLMLVGIAGFLIPEQYSLTSGAAPYNVFHIIFGAIGLVLMSSKNDLLASSFNLGFGLIDLYQVLASVVGLTPIQYFHWTYLDDVVHVLLGFALVIIGGYGIRQWKEKQDERSDTGG